MQQDKKGSIDSKKTIDKDTKHKARMAYIDKALKKISPTGEEQAKSRAKKIMSGLGCGMLSWILSGGRFFFTTYPFSLALLCATEKNLIFILCAKSLKAVKAVHLAALVLARNAYVRIAVVSVKSDRIGNRGGKPRF